MTFTSSISNHASTTAIYTLSLHGRSSDLVIWLVDNLVNWNGRRTVSFPERLHDPHTVSAPKLRWNLGATPTQCLYHPIRTRSEEHTSELQSLTNLVCRLLLEKKKSDSK